MVEQVDNGDRQVSVRAMINAPVEELYALVANPHRHHELDGSGTVGENISGPEKLSTGDTFSMHMKQFGLPYKTTSTVTKAEENRVIEWQLGIGQKWRWEFEPLGDARTQVTESFDVRDVPGIAATVFRIAGMFGRNQKGLTETLRKLQQKYGATS